MSTIKGYKPHPRQLQIHNSIRNEPYKFYTLNIGRQFGKTMLCINQFLDWMINDAGTKGAWVSPIYKQSKKVYKEMKKATEKSGLFEYNDTDLIISGFGSTLQFFSGERPDNIRGETFHYLVIDEMAFTRPELWTEVLRATVLVKGKKVVFISTPKGKNHFHSLCLQHNYSDQYKYFHFTSYDNPMIPSEEIDSIRRELPDHIFRQEYLAEFMDNASGLFKNVRQSVGNPKSSGTKYFGLDIGRADDYTVITIQDKSGHVLDVQRWRHDEWSKIIDKVAQVIKKWNATGYVEVNNQGDVFYEMLRSKVGNLAQPFTTTTKTKPMIIEELAVDFEQGNIVMPEIDFLIDELEAFTYIFDPRTRRVKYSAPEGVHDDCVMSLAICNHARLNLSRKGQYFVVR